MRRCSIALVFLTLLFGIAQANASVNATASPTSLGTFPSTGDRSGPFVSKPSSARDEERVNGIKEIGWAHKVTTLLAKSTRAVWKQAVNTQLQVKIAWWRLTNAHPYFVFSELKLAKVGEDILSNSRFHEWVKYVKRFNSGHPNEKVSIVEKLREQYGDLKLAVMLIQAQNDADTSLQAFATELQTELMLHGWRPENTDPPSVYTELGLDKVDKYILSNSWFNAWIDYVENYNVEHPNEQVSIVAILEKQYGDYMLAKMLIRAQKDANTSLQAVATKLQIELMSYWRDRQIDAHVVFRILGLDMFGNNLFLDPAFKIWYIYVSEYNPGAPVTLFDQLYNSLGNAGLCAVIFSSKRSQETASLATNLQDQLLKLWSKEGLKPRDVFRHLGLFLKPQLVPDDPELEVWMKYVEMYREETKKEVDLNEIIQSYYNADEIEVIISSATTDHGKILANELKAAQAIGNHV